MVIDTLHVSIALAPLAVYFMLLGMINLFHRPMVTTGARDVAALGLGISGFVLVGPMQLFLPEAAATQFGWTVWLLLLGFYGLCLMLVVLLMRPRLVIYNTNSDQLRPILAGILPELDPKARWAGDSLVLASIEVKRARRQPTPAQLDMTQAVTTTISASGRTMISCPP